MAMGPNTYGTFYDCHEKPVRGDCWGRELRWAYDPYWQDCYRFLWGGCGGNKNTFITYAVCREICGRGSQQRQCKHTYKFEDYIEWPEDYNKQTTSKRNICDTKYSEK
ncbi:kappaPI-actitoxin-Avd3e-like [Hyposmocoma kahamanoa]|uniref:kappaPI-actitoxin-Avd3e-like n=1 Tax=Hyposmocoma kahamanoa TaxID=1477025 RepID=UPI000E6D7069|nr:kappaPI-actitoxin-Avd3e-like [Hyposmocoma kahamanoa]